MTERGNPAHVGAPDPELKNSPIVEETDEDFEFLIQELSENNVCYFNGSAYDQGAFICSGNELLRCEQGAWVREGSCDPDNP
jgi:hypothetical protein